MTVASDRVEFRLTPELKSELEEAASAVGVTVASFVKDAALRTARQTLREQRQLQLEAAAWLAFTAAIDRQGQLVPGLTELFDRPSLLSAG